MLGLSVAGLSHAIGLQIKLGMSQFDQKTLVPGAKRSRAPCCFICKCRPAEDATDLRRLQAEDSDSRFHQVQVPEGKVASACPNYHHVLVKMQGSSCMPPLVSLDATASCVSVKSLLVVGEPYLKSSPSVRRRSLESPSVCQLAMQMSSRSCPPPRCVKLQGCAVLAALRSACDDSMPCTRTCCHRLFKPSESRAFFVCICLSGAERHLDLA